MANETLGLNARTLGPALLLSLVLTGCGSRQTYYHGAIVPIHTPTLTSQVAVDVAPSLPACLPGCPCARWRHSKVRRVAAAAGRYTPGLGFQYPHVINDPAPIGYQPNTSWDVGKTPSAPAPAAVRKSLHTFAISGNWTVTGAPAGCILRLSQQPLLDLRRASASGCGEAPIAKVTGWRAKGKSIELFTTGMGTSKLDFDDGGALVGTVPGGKDKLRLTRSP